MLDNLFTGGLLACLASMVAIAATGGGTQGPPPAPVRAAQTNATHTPLLTEARVLPATAQAPMPIYQLPRVVVQGNVNRESALFADGAPAAGRAGAPAALR